MPIGVLTKSDVYGPINDAQSTIAAIRERIEFIPNRELLKLVEQGRFDLYITFLQQPSISSTVGLLAYTLKDDIISKFSGLQSELTVEMQSLIIKTVDQINDYAFEAGVTTEHIKVVREHKEKKPEKVIDYQALSLSSETRAPLFSATMKLLLGKNCYITPNTGHKYSITNEEVKTILGPAFMYADLMVRGKQMKERGRNLEWRDEGGSRGWSGYVISPTKGKPVIILKPKGGYGTQWQTGRD